LEPSGRSDLRLTLAGLQAGCLGSLLMIGWWLLGELIQRRSPWIVPNLLATTFYGEHAYRSAFTASTWSGLAGPLAVYCIVGVVFALAGRERKAGWLLVVVSGAAGLALDWLVFGVILRRVNPFIQIYSPDRLIAVSHLLYGLALSSYPAFARDLAPGDRSIHVMAGFPESEHAESDHPESDHPESDQQVGRGIP